MAACLWFEKSAYSIILVFTYVMLLIVSREGKKDSSTAACRWELRLLLQVIELVAVALGIGMGDWTAREVEFR